MPKSKIDQAREERITNEIVVDCYNESERFSGWYCYLEDKLKFSFRARCVVTNPVLLEKTKAEYQARIDDLNSHCYLSVPASKSWKFVKTTTGYGMW
jgi:hypothetical protein